jgi:putative tryptophan/tyrosine transport system substrate-binding protein
MDRRTALSTLAAYAALLPRAAVAAALPRVVYDLARVGDRARSWYAEHGLVDGRNIALIAEPLNGLAPEAMQARARSVLASRPDAVVAFHWDSVFLYRRLTREIPVVFVNFGADPVRYKLVESMRRPGGNLTGTCQQLMSMTPKFFELLRELRPGARRGGVLVAERSIKAEHMIQGREEVERAAMLLGMAIELVVVPDDPQLAAVRAQIEQARLDVLFIPDDLYGLPVLDELTGYLVAARLPALYITPEYVHKGGLVSIAPDRLEGHRMAVEMVARILRGEKPGTMPVYQATRYRTTINLRTARAMRLVVPPAVLTRADEVVE